MPSCKDNQVADASSAVDADLMRIDGLLRSSGGAQRLFLWCKRLNTAMTNGILLLE